MSAPAFPIALKVLLQTEGITMIRFPGIHSLTRRRRRGRGRRRTKPPHLLNRNFLETKDLNVNHHHAATNLENSFDNTDLGETFFFWLPHCLKSSHYPLLLLPIDVVTYLIIIVWQYKVSKSIRSFIRWLAGLLLAISDFSWKLRRRS